MAKTKYVEASDNWDTAIAYRDPDDSGYWQVHYDGKNLGLTTNGAKIVIELLKAIIKEEEK